MKRLAYVASCVAFLYGGSSCQAAGANAGSVTDLQCTVAYPLTCGYGVKSVGAIRAPGMTKAFFLIRYRAGNETVDLFPEGFMSRSVSSQYALDANKIAPNYLTGLPENELQAPEQSYDFSKCKCDPNPSKECPSLEIIPIYELDGAPICFAQKLSIPKTNQTHMLFFTEQNQPVHTVLKLNFEKK